MQPDGAQGPAAEVAERRQRARVGPGPDDQRRADDGRGTYVKIKCKIK